MTGTDGSPEGASGTFGPYRLDRRLGRGGMGEVYRAYDTRRDREVALKLLSPELADDPEIRERFERECRTAARLSSPHVVPIHDFGVIDGRLYLDMRLIEGRDLARVLREDGPLDPARAVGIVEQIADALDDAHAHDLVHRDVKPGNVLVSTGRGQDFVHLVDFGIVRLGESTTHGRALTGTGTTLGTLAYMSPEQFEGSAVDKRADVYALAVVLHEVLVGRTPFEGDMPAMLHQHLRVEPEPPSSRRPGLGTVLDAVVARGMAKDPRQRYAEAGELAEDARQAVGARTAAPAPPVTPTPERSRETQVGPSGPPSPPPGSIPSSPPYPAAAPTGGQVHWDSGSHAAAGPYAATAPGGPGGPGGPVPPWGGGPGGPGGYGGYSGYGGYGAPPYGPPQQQPQQPPKRRKGLVIGLAAVALLLVAAVVVTLVVVLGKPDDTPATVALGPGPALSQMFVDSTRGGCEAGDQTVYRLATGVVPESVTQCTRGAATIAYVLYPTADDAAQRVTSYQTSASTDGFRNWNIENVQQGPYFQTIASGQCTAVAAYTGVRVVLQVYTPTADCAPVTQTFTTVGLPTNEELRAPESAVPGAAAAGCAAGPTAPGASGLVPRQARRCSGPEGTTVTWSRWNGPGDVTTEVTTRSTQAGGGATSWNAPGGPRLGPYIRDENGGGCRALLGWDRAAYSAEVVGADCDTVDRAVARLAPPPATGLPA